MLNPTQSELVQFLNEEANVAIARACRTGGAKANSLIAEAQELLALRARVIERHAPSANVVQFELPFLMKAAA